MVETVNIERCLEPVLDLHSQVPLGVCERSKYHDGFHGTHILGVWYTMPQK